MHAEAGLGVGIRCHQIPGVVHLPVDEVGDVPAEARPATLPSRAALGQVVWVGSGPTVHAVTHDKTRRPALVMGWWED